MNGYELSKKYWDWAWENPAKNSPNHAALFFFFVELANRLNWKPEFSVSAKECQDSIGISSYKTFKKSFDVLVDAGMIIIVKKSTNQYQANLIALVKNTEAPPKANGFALVKNTEASSKQVQSTSHNLKTRETIKPKKKNGVDLDTSFVPTVYLPLVDDWIAYRKSIGKPYKTQLGLTQFFSKLVRLSGNNLAKAMQLVEHAKSKEWLDVYPLKKDDVNRECQILQPKDEERKNELLKRFNNGHTSSN